MKTCETCKHWMPFSQTDLNYQQKKNQGDCNRIPHISTLEDDSMPDNEAKVDDVEGYSAWLTTAKHFGCVLHEGK